MSLVSFTCYVVVILRFILANLFLKCNDTSLFKSLIYMYLYY